MAIQARHRVEAAVTLRVACRGLSLAVALSGCANSPPAPDWQLTAKAALERSVSAYLQGNAKTEAVEFAAARSALARTGRADLLARAELTRCAARVASLMFESCAGYTPLATDAGEQPRAYNDYLGGTLRPGDAALLPEQHRVFATDKVPLADLQAMGDPLAQLVAAAVLLRTGRAEAAVLDIAADTASAQGWSRPLLAWLSAQLMRAQATGDAQKAEQVQRRIERVAGKAGTAGSAITPRP